MPEFSKKSVKFNHKGMQWNRPIDAIPDGQICYGRNIRIGQQDTITQRPGTTNFATFAAPLVDMHSMAVLNNSNTDLVNFTKAYVMSGYVSAGPPDVNEFFVGTQSGLTSAVPSGPLGNAINPVLLPTGIKFTASGNPVTMVDMAPVGTNIGWKYIGDASINVSLGYYPGDSQTPGAGNNLGMARALTMGMTPPVYTGIPTIPGGVGLLNGNYQWMFAYRNKFTGARSNPSAPSRVTLAVPALPLANQSAQFTTPATPTDPQTGAADANIVVDIYRYGGTLFDWRYVGTTAGNTSFTDNAPDSAILTASSPPEVTDAVTGVTRFNLYRPFPVQTNAVYSTTNGTVSLSASGSFLLTVGGGDVFDVNWIQGSPISVNNHLFTIYQVISAAQLELAEDATGDVPLGARPWATQNGNLKAGAPMAHIWGPYGIGSGGAFVFGCGGSASGGTSMVDAGTLYWTNGNDPDSADIANSLVVTSPSEPLRGGCIYDGTSYVFSTERMFRIYPGAVAGQFTVQEIPGGKGLWAEYSLTVQSNGIADQSITWVGKDGIYDWSSTAGLICLTDRDLYPFFPHDNLPGIDLATLFPFLAGTEAVPVFPPDFSAAKMRFHRLCWFQGELFYDFPTTNSSYMTLVFDSKQANGWVSLDQYGNGIDALAAKPVARGIEIAGNTMIVGIGRVTVNYAITLSSDSGTAITSRVVTKQDDLGDARAQKLWGDFMFDGSIGNGSSISITPMFGYSSALGSAQTFSLATRFQKVYTTVATGLGYLSTSMGFDFTWSAGGTPAVLYQYEVSYVPKPPLTGLLATDKTDDGYNGAKYLRGLCIESDTANSPRTVKVLVDGAIAATLTVTADGQQELPFSITPVVGSEFQLQPTDTSNLWGFYTVRWVWEKWPDLDTLQSNWLNLGTTKPKYVRSFSIPISGPASPSLSFTVTYDGASTYATSAVAPASLTAKSPAQYSINPPILAHQLKLTPSTACRAFYDEIVWDAEEWPELATMYGPVEKLGDSGAKYLRGFELPMETGGSGVVMTLLYDQQPTDTTGATSTETFDSVSTAALSKNVFSFTPASPIVAHEFQLRSLQSGRFWYSEVKWDFEPWPERSDGSAAWTDMGDPGVKFLQGLVIPVDTAGQAASFTLHYDAGGTVTVGPFTTTAGAKTAVPFSFGTPLVVHEVQLVKNSSFRAWTHEVKWIWEPMPELVTTYTTQPTDHDLPGYHYMFDCYIAYIGTAQAPTLTITTEYGSIQYALPVSNGVYTRAYQILQPQKAKWRTYSITCPSGVRLYLKDCEVRAKNWTDKGNYPSAFTSHTPFGEISRVYGARI
jgi:hypothetical protein